MTLEQLIAEGRKLQRPCLFLRPQGTGQVAAVWYERNDEESESAGHCWLTVDSRHIPGVAPFVNGFLSIFTDEDTCQGGRVEVAPSWPERGGTPLFAHPALVLPPIDAVFARGSDAVGDWIRSHGWGRTDRYNDNFKDAAIVSEYERIWMREFPLYSDSGVYAVLGGWHRPYADADWHDLVDEQLMIMTVRGSEPWVEAWCDRASQFKVIQRIT